MNDRHVPGGGLLKYPRAPKETRLISDNSNKWSRSIGVLLIVTVMGVTMIPPGPTFAEDPALGTDNSNDTAIEVESWLLTVPYIIGKSAFAVAGSVVGGLGYVFSGGNSRTAESVWTTSVYGDYIIRPAHLRGEEPVRFLGKTNESQNEPAPHRAEAASGPSGSEGK